MRRGIILSDTHCGHRVGLTPPAWWGERVKAESRTKHNKWRDLRASLWRHYVKILKEYGPFDFGLFAGDAIDGEGARSSGTELIQADRQEQVTMAVECFNTVRMHAKKGFEWVGVYGTPYHTGAAEDWENDVAKDAGFKKYGAHEWVDVDGCVFDLKHKVSSSAVPHGRHTAIAKENLWNVLWSERDLAPRANVILRGHVHYHTYAGGPGWVAMTLPALQGMGSKFGARQCSGLVDWGVVIVDVDKDGSFDWHAEIVQIREQKAEVVRL